MALDHRIAGHHDELRVNTLAKKVAPRLMCGCKMQVRCDGCEASIEFFGKRSPLVVRAEPSLHVPQPTRR
jgi:hypothetical protein